MTRDLDGGDGNDMLADAPVVKSPEEGRLLSAAVPLVIEEDEVISPEEGSINVLSDSGGRLAEALVRGIAGVVG